MRNQIIDNLRGLCLLGVLGIHIGTLAEQTHSFWFFSIFEILSRFSVPTFFFISGYGLFCRDNELLALSTGKSAAGAGFAYLPFLKQRLRSSCVPYLSWSFFYQLYFSLTLGYLAWWPKEQLFLLSLGLSCYHLYFMVILIVFYLTHPLWRQLMKLLLRTGIWLGMSVLLVLQLVLYYYSSHNHINPENWLPLLKNMYVYRLNYVPLYYLFIYMLGGLTALYWPRVASFLQKHTLGLILFFAASLFCIEGSAYYSYTYEGYDLLSLAYTYHQLSPQGLFYTMGCIACFCMLLQRCELHLSAAEKPFSLPLSLGRKLYSWLQKLTRYSLLMYFIHPLLLDIMTNLMRRFGIVPTIKRVTLVYVLLVLFSLIASMDLQRLWDRFPRLGLLFTGRK